MTAVALSSSPSPVASILVVTYGGWEWCRRALEAVARNTDVPHEVIVVDNASPDGTGERLRDEVRGATVILNPRNVGFGPAVNQAAAVARGRFLALLNPDAEVQPGWLPLLVEALRRRRDVGAVVGRLLNVDGSLQEAGSLLWSDGSTLALGVGADPSDPAYRFSFSSDYGSAACLLIRRSTFLDEGGFDAAYLPAYCEDVDLALRLRERGLRVLYEPRAAAVHARFASSGEDGAARLIERNRQVLRSRWAGALAGRIAPPDEDHPHRTVAGRDADALDRIVVAAPSTPMATLLELARRFPEDRVTWLATGGRPDAEAIDELAEAGVEVAVPERAAAWLDERLFHFSAVVLLGAGAAAVVVDELEAAQPQAEVVYAFDGPPRDASLRRAEVTALRRAASVVCANEAERRFASELCPGEVRVDADADLPSVLVAELRRLGFAGDLAAPPAGTAPRP
ncbi:MAG TPA: glycosyltransferase family 2 protein [Actinomycetota bacterium]|nr:glycosyltransferase family 2 protein [Actinomycetota bacterium]